MSRRMGLVAGLVAVAIALSGCVSIPRAGGVVAGPAIIEDEEDGIGIVTLAKGPQAGANQEEILIDFIRAATSPKNDYEIARQFLTDGLADLWDPDNGVLIRVGGAPVTAISENALRYTFSVTAAVDETGRFAEQSQPAVQSLDFSFAQEGGEWRISEAPDGVVLSENSFATVFDEHALYFFDSTFRYLVPDVRWFPARATIPSKIVRALLAGPSSWLGQGVVLSEFPTATGLRSEVEITSGTATVDLTEEATTATGAQRDRMRQQLLATLGAVSSGVSSVAMTVGGLPLNVPGENFPDAVQNPTVESAALVLADGEFGYATGDAISPIAELSAKVSQVGASAATLSNDRSAAAVLGQGGTVYVVRTGDTPPLALDSRPGLVAPAIDTLGFIWSAPSGSAAGITTFDFDGGQHPIASSLPADARVASFDISRDGARIVLYLATSVGPRLVVAGIKRQENVPVGLGELVDLPIGGGTPVDSAWVDSRTVATVSRDGTQDFVTTYQIGGPSGHLAQAPGATTIAGGNGGTSGIRVLAGGQLLRPQGSGGWQDTGISASFLGTQQ